MVGVLCLHVFVFVQAAFEGCFEEYCFAHGVKTNEFLILCWDYAHERFTEGILTTRQYHGETDIMPPPSACLAGSASSSGAASGGAAASSSQRPAGPEASSRPPQPAGAEASEPNSELDENVYAEHVARWAEEASCREKLDELSWTTAIPKRPDTMEQMHQVKQVLVKYMDSFEHHCTHEWDCSKFPLNPRIWIAEAIWTFQALNKNGDLPMAITQPGDRHIRTDAGQAADGFDDPGNLMLDIAVNLLCLWKFVAANKVEAVMKVAAGEYGTRGNQSSKGPVNFRGNIIEAASIQLQRMSKIPEATGLRWQSSSSTKPWPVGLLLGCHVYSISDVFSRCWFHLLCLSCNCCMSSCQQICAQSLCMHVVFPWLEPVCRMAE
jgi:hypothetical protein